MHTVRWVMLTMTCIQASALSTEHGPAPAQAWRGGAVLRTREDAPRALPNPLRLQGGFIRAERRHVYEFDEDDERLFNSTSTVMKTGHPHSVCGVRCACSAVRVRCACGAVRWALTIARRLPSGVWLCVPRCCTSFHHHPKCFGGTCTCRTKRRTQTKGVFCNTPQGVFRF